MQTLSAFARIVELPENRSALAALKEVFDRLTAATPVDGPDPVFIHGPTGCGKSALLLALAEAAREAQFTVCELSADEFPLPPSVVEGPEAQDEALRLEEARRSDLLIIEDLQDLPARAAETLVTLLDRRARKSRPVVCSATVGPRQLASRSRRHPARLTNRLAAGLVVGIEPWRPGSRRRFLATLARSRGLQLPPESLTWLADNLTGGGRQLTGAVRQLEMLVELQKQHPPLDRLREHFRVEVEGQRPSVESIAERVSGYFQVEPRQLKSTRRSRDLLLARQVSMYLARRLTPLSLQQIGAYFGGRDHSTVLHACRKIEETMQSDRVLSGAVRRLQAELS